MWHFESQLDVLHEHYTVVDRLHSFGYNFCYTTRPVRFPHTAKQLEPKHFLVALPMWTPLAFAASEPMAELTHFGYKDFLSFRVPDHFGRNPHPTFPTNRFGGKANRVKYG